MNKYKNLPVFKKASEILEITHAIVESIDEEKDILGVREMMLCNAALMGSKIAGAEGAELYSLRMENAVLIKLAACELKVQTNLLRADEIIDHKYLDLLRGEIDNFKPLFIEWIKTFDVTDDINDGWLWIEPPKKDDID
jgi:hypothetical protein